MAESVRLVVQPTELRERLLLPVSSTGMNAMLGSGWIADMAVRLPSGRRGLSHVKPRKARGCGELERVPFVGARAYFSVCAPCGVSA
jgi:hypothetical protein